MVTGREGRMRNTKHSDDEELTVVKHAMATIDFGVELTDHASKENHGYARHQEHVSQPVWESP